MRISLAQLAIIMHFDGRKCVFRVTWSNVALDLLNYIHMFKHKSSILKRKKNRRYNIKNIDYSLHSFASYPNTKLLLFSSQWTFCLSEHLYSVSVSLVSNLHFRWSVTSTLHVVVISFARGNRGCCRMVDFSSKTSLFGSYTLLVPLKATNQHITARTHRQNVVFLGPLFDQHPEIKKKLATWTNTQKQQRIQDIK